MTTTQEIDLAFRGPGALARLVRDGEVHPRELVELSLRRIEALNPKLNAFRTTLAEQALAEAEDPSRPWTGPLAGVPIAVKDDLPVKGQTTTWGTHTPPAPRPDDAVTVAALRAAGAIVIGITNVPELMAFPWTVSDANGITRNPWDLSRTPGGSSGGSASAVAAGLLAAATGSDGGGSIRIPSACCGLVGMKPTRGLVPADPLPQDGWLGLNVFGALARTVSDSALMLDVMARAKTPAAAASTVAGPFQAAAAVPPDRRLRIAVSRKLPIGATAKVSVDQVLAFDRTARLLAELGHHVIERDPSYGSVQLEFGPTFLRAVYEDSLKLGPNPRIERGTRGIISLGERIVPPAARDRLLKRRAATSARILALWDEVDVLLTPALSRTALPAEGGYEKPGLVALELAGRFTPFTPAFNMTGQPAVALPAGFGADGLPTSVQLVGRPGAEALLYALAGEIESAQPWAPHTPPIG